MNRSGHRSRDMEVGPQRGGQGHDEREVYRGRLDHREGQVNGEAGLQAELGTWGENT